MTFEKPREIAIKVLAKRAKDPRFVEAILDDELANNRLSPPDRRLAQELVLGIVRWQRTLDWLIDQKAKQRTGKPALRNLLRLGLYQLFWLDRIPDHAAVHETVELARKLGCGRQSGFLNAMLRSYIRNRAATSARLSELKASLPALGWSHPDWLWERWRQRWSSPDLKSLLEWNNQPPPTFARANTLRIQPSRLREVLQDEKVTFEPIQRDWIENDLAFEITDSPPFQGLRSFSEGFYYIQDPSTLLAVHELEPQPGETILDYCAAPGGKTTYLAQRMNGQGQIYVHDPQPARMELLRENCRRLGVACVVEFNPADRASKLASCDRVLVDAPCSNTGVMRRRVDLRWRIRASEIQRLQRLQLDLLGQASLHVRPDGVLVYSTCSLEPEENEKVVEEFLRQQPGFELERQRQLLPFADGVDGAYVARLRRAR